MIRRLGITVLVLGAAVWVRLQRLLFGVRRRLPRWGWVGWCARALAVAIVPAGVLAREAARSSAAAAGAVPDPSPDPVLLAKLREKQDDWKAWLRSPQAVSQRAASRTAHAGANPAAAQSADRKAFPRQIEAPGFQVLDPSAGKVLRRLGSSAALVQDRAGHRSLVESSLPLDGKTTDGRSAPLDLGLHPDPGGFTPNSTLVPVSVPGASDGELRFPREGFGVRFGHAGAVNGQPVGGSVFYPDAGGVGADTDAVVRPVALGAEVSYMLRSRHSPEQQMLPFDLPRGWHLAEPGDNSGNVQVVDETGKVKATVLRPIASDAQGQSVRASLQIKDATDLTLSVSHQSGDFAYPILVDPGIVADYHDSSPFANWGQYNPTGKFTATNASGSGGHSGWKMAAKPYNNGEQAYYYRHAPAGAYISALSENGVYHTDNAPSSTSQEFGGIVGSNGWEPGTWSVNNGAANSGGADAYKPGSLSNTNFKYCARPGCTSGPTSGIQPNNAAIFGLLASPSSTQGSSPANDYVSDAILALSDSVIPTVGVTHNGYQPGSWVQNASDTVAATGQVSTGLGMSQLAITGVSATPSSTSPASCNAVGPEGQSSMPCPASVSGSFSYSTQSLPEGTTALTVTGTNAAGNQATQSWNVNIDRSAPTITLSGGPPSSGIAQGSYQLNIAATDGNGTIPTSGVGSVSVAIDGTAVSTPAASCPAGQKQCTASTSWTLNASSYPAGRHTIVVTATDGAGNSSSTSTSFTTGSQISYSYDANGRLTSVSGP
jgi:hypothetical protein